MRFGPIIVGAMLGLVWLNVCLGQQPGDILQTRDKAELSVNGKLVSMLPRGTIVQVKDFDKAEPDFLWCRSNYGLGWVARAELMTLQDAVPVWQELIDAGDFTAYFSLGAAHDQLDDFQRAEEDFNACVWYFPQWVEAIDRRAFERIKLGRPKKAERDHSVVIRIRPNSESYSNRADTRLILGDGEGAVADCQQALKLDPRNIFGIVNQANAERMLGHFDKAIADYQRAAKTNPGWSAVSRNHAFLLAACPDPQYRDGQQALELAKKACETSQYHDSWSLSSLAVACAEAGDFDSALKWQIEAIKCNKLPPNEPEHRRRLESFQAKQPYRFKVGDPVLDD